MFIDAPLLIYLNTVADERIRAIYENFYVDILAKHKPYTDVLVLDELICISRRKYGIPYKVSLEFIESNVLPYVNVLSLGEDEYRRAAEIIAEHGMKPSDALHVAAMLNNGITLVATEDKDYDRVPAMTRLWIS